MPISFTDRFIQRIFLRVHRMTPKNRFKLLNGLSRTILRLSKRTRQRTISNIKRAMPYLRSTEAYALAIESYACVVSGVLDTFWLNELEIEYEFDQKTKNILYSGKGAVIATLHMNCYETVPLAIQQLTGRSTTLSKLPENFPLVANNYQQAEIECIDKNQPNSLFKLISALQKNRIVTLHADHYANDIEMEFFEQKTKAPSGAALLSSLGNAPLLLGYSVKLNDARYRVYFETISDSPLGKDKQLHKEYMNKLYRRFEQIILDFPNQWYWSYNRWR